MFKNKWFYVGLIGVYILYLSKDNMYEYIDNKEKINEYVCSLNVKNYQEEYESLSKLLGIEVDNKKVLYSKVIFRDIYEFYDKITIAKGKNDGVEKGQAVINELGLVGVVSRVYKSYSEVKLLTNHDLSISVKINDSYGIMYAKNNKLYVKNLKLQEDIKVNDKVYTSGLTNIPSNILIGEVKKVKKDSLELEYILKLDGYNDFIDLKYVGVII